ncbi:hypothetical protein HID58_085817 [Brassica napus]|uniref:Uncharacterized protein n=1 Tax=Brassica napus TaxID=3708 RepID=A0ABQ7XNV2_BRANA|nr:hypothetical protein HID58_085817 [Brassica napus]
MSKNLSNSMNANLNMDSAGTSDRTVLKRNSKDIAWDYGILESEERGAYRIKEHIANIPGNVSACPKSSKDDKEKCKNAIEEAN